MPFCLQLFIGLEVSKTKLVLSRIDLYRLEELKEKVNKKIEKKNNVNLINLDGFFNLNIFLMAKNETKKLIPSAINSFLIFD